MANGLLGKAVGIANTNVTVYTAPAGIVFSTATVVICNRSTTAVTVKMAVSTTDTPADTDYVMFNVTIDPGQTLEQSCTVMSAGEKVVVNSSSADVSIRVYGMEKAA